MLLVVTGVFLLLLGLFAGAVLVAVPLGMAAWTAAGILWVLFPLFCGVGYVLFVIGARTAQVRAGSLVIACLMLLLAATSALALVLRAAGVVPSDGEAPSLWYVMVVAGILGIIGAASLSRLPAQSDTDQLSPQKP